MLITYVSAYGYTGDMAHAIASGIRENDQVEVEILDIERIDFVITSYSIHYTKLYDWHGEGQFSI